MSTPDPASHVDCDLRHTLLAFATAQFSQWSIAMANAERCNRISACALGYCHLQRVACDSGYRTSRPAYSIGHLPYRITHAMPTILCSTHACRPSFLPDRHNMCCAGARRLRTLPRPCQCFPSIQCKAEDVVSAAAPPPNTPPPLLPPFSPSLSLVLAAAAAAAACLPQPPLNLMEVEADRLALRGHGRAIWLAALGVLTGPAGVSCTDHNTGLLLVRHHQRKVNCVGDRAQTPQGSGAIPHATPFQGICCKVKPSRTIASRALESPLTRLPLPAHCLKLLHRR